MVARSLRATGLAITLVTLVTVSTFAYSFGAEFDYLRSTLGGGAASPGIHVQVGFAGSTLTVGINVSMKNAGLYPLTIGLSCINPAVINATCSSSNVDIMPGRSGSAKFTIVVHGVPSLTAALSLRLDAKVHVEMQPFGAGDAVFDVGSLIQRGL